MKQSYTTSIAHNPPVEGRQLELFTHTGNRYKPQISSISGIHPKERNRYRVSVGDEILGTQLSLDEALKLAKGGAK
jgi:hypothetical protein